MPTRSRMPWFAILPLFLGGIGCASVTNPVADGIPVRRLPAEVLGRSKSELKPIPLTSLRQKEAEKYLLDKGDTLAIVADNIIAPESVQAPVRLPDALNPNSSIGFPTPVNDDATISLPRLPKINVKGKTLTQIETEIKELASGKNGGPELINPKNARVTVQLLQKRTYNVTVVREDSQQQQQLQQGVGGTVVGTSRRGAGFTLRMQEGENDVLRALNATGGPPGLDAKDEIVIERGQYDPDQPEKNRTRIPLRLYAEQKLELCEADIILHEGDVVKIESRDTASEVFYVAGVAGSRPFILPRDYDLDVLQALATAGAPLANGGFTQNAFIAQSVNSGLGAPSPALLTVLRPLGNGRQIPIRVDLNLALRDPRERIRVLPGDVLVLQERPGDAFARYMTQTFRFSTSVPTFNAPGLTQVLTGTNP